MLYEYSNNQHTSFSTQKAWGVQCDVQLSSAELRGVVAQGIKSDLKAISNATGDIFAVGLAAGVPLVFSAIVGTILHKENPMTVMAPLALLFYAALPHYAPMTISRVESLLQPRR